MAFSLPRKSNAYRKNLFDAQRLTSSDIIDNTILEFEGAISSASFERIMEDVLVNEEPGTLQLILSCKYLPRDVSEPLCLTRSHVSRRN